MPSLKSLRFSLQTIVSPTDRTWSYQLPGLPNDSELDESGLVKCITFSCGKSSFPKVDLSFVDAPSNRMTRNEPLHKFILLSVAEFRVCYPADAPEEGVRPAPARETGDYLTRLTTTGLSLNGQTYHFFGNSNSQTKSRSCFLYAATKAEISEKIEAAGDFSKMKTVAKKVKRVGLLFSSANVGVTLAEERCQDIDDIERDGYCFTDGCGLISQRLARFLAQRHNITFRNKRYVPTVFQIRYRGYKGVLMVDPSLKGEIAVQFRGSMKKFSDAKDLTLSVVDYSKPYSFGYLNDETVLLMSALGISNNMLLKKQRDHIDMLRSTAQGTPPDAFRFLTSQGHLSLAEKLLIGGVESVKGELRRLVKGEFAKMINKRDEQRCRIMIPQSRLLFGVCDPGGRPGRKGRIPEGCVFVRITKDGDGEARTVINTEVMVARNPCLHPGDLPKFRAIDVPEYAHLVDCIVFSTEGKRPGADMMSGGDLDGDKFFVTWDSEIIPSVLSEPALYPGGKEPLSFGPITDDDRAEYFARYTSASLGRVKNLYMKWARLKGSMSPECQELNRLFSQCVDGNRIKIPPRLEDAPGDGDESIHFVLDVLHTAAKEAIESAPESDAADEYSFEALDVLLSRDQVTMSEHELVQLTIKWCDRHNVPFEDYLPFFHLSALTDEQQAWLIGRLPVSPDTPSLIRNGLTQSDLVSVPELRRFKLDHARLHWRPVFRSKEDRMGRFLPTLCRSLEIFHKKFIVLEVDERLAIGIYVPRQVPKASEAQVDASVRVFAFPRSSGAESSKYCVVPTKHNYRLYYDEHVFQLYNFKRGDTWIFLQRGPQNDSSYRNTINTGDKLRKQQVTLDNRVNFDCRASIALQKINSGIQKHVGKLNRAGILGAEIYTISNRDIRSMKLLDQWLHFVDTEEILPLFEETQLEYDLPRIDDLSLNDIPSAVLRVVKRRDLDGLEILPSMAEVHKTLTIAIMLDAKAFLGQIYTRLLELAATGKCILDTRTLTGGLLAFLPKAVYLIQLFFQSDAWRVYAEELKEDLKYIGYNLLRELILLADRMHATVRSSFRLLLQHLTFLSFDEFAELLQLAALTIRSPETAMDLLLEGLEPETSRLLTGRPNAITQFAKSLIGIVLNHVDEIQDARPSDGTIQLEANGDDSGFAAVKASVRIDSPLNGMLKKDDHVRLTVSQPPANAPLAPPFSMAALVAKSELGLVSFKCLHPPPSFLDSASWKITHYGPFVTAKTMFDAVTKFHTQKTECCALYSYLTLAGGEDVKMSHQPLPYAGSESLNYSQNLAVRAALEKPLTLLWGPPGTGKTHTVVAILIQLLQKLPNHRVLLTAPTHNAVDNILEKFISQDGISKTGLNPLRVSTDVSKVSPTLRKYTCDAMMGKETNSSFAAYKQAAKKVKESRLIFTTCTGAGLGLLRNETFQVVLVDEASQQTEPETLIPLVKGCQRAVLVGDHVQLRATVQRSAVATGFDVSLFETHYSLPETATKAKVMLDTQYRMHANICEFSSQEFYESKLQTAILDSARPLKPSQFPWPTQARKVFLQCAASEDIGRQSKSNSGQAHLCKRVCELLCSLPSSVTTSDPTVKAFQPSDVGILTPYTRQKDLLKTLLPRHEVSSIDGFQGREAEIIVFVTTRCNLSREMGFLTDMRRLNVAATRAKTGFIIIGDRETLTTVAPGTEMEESKSCWARLLGQCDEVPLQQESQV